MGNILNILGTGGCNCFVIPIVPECLLFEGRKQVRVVFDIYLEVVNWVVWLVEHGC